MSEEVGNVGWQNQETIYIIMWQSKRSGGTYTEIRRTEAGKNRLLTTLAFMGVPRHEVNVSEQKKLWMPDLNRNKKSTRKVRALGDEQREQRLETEKAQLHTAAGRTYLQ